MGLAKDEFAWFLPLTCDLAEPEVMESVKRCIRGLSGSKGSTSYMEGKVRWRGLSRIAAHLPVAPPNAGRSNSLTQFVTAVL